MSLACMWQLQLEAAVALANRAQGGLDCVKRQRAVEASGRGASAKGQRPSSVRVYPKGVDAKWRQCSPCAAISACASAYEPF